MKLSTNPEDPFMPAPAYGQSLQGLSINLLVRDLDRAIHFHREILQVRFLHEDRDLAIVAGYGTTWMIHADHTYDKHALHRTLAGVALRGTGLEIRLHGLDPDGAEARAREHSYAIVSPAIDQPDHGLREAHIRDGEGYIWVPDISL
jgi:predicted enzyme related to lactoylglutathione lyase